MAPKEKIDAGVSAGREGVRNLKDELFKLDKRLRELVDAFEEEPDAIDGGVLGNDGCSGEVETAIMGVYRIVKGRVFSEESPLQADNELWEAFREQQDEFMEFYRFALRAVEIHKEILQYYGLVKDVARLRPRHGDLERIRQDKCAYVTERDECITAVSNFCGKFSAMLTAL
jgi:hypothetical protein